MSDVVFVRCGGDRDMFRVTVDASEMFSGTSFCASVEEVTAWETDGSPAEFEPYLRCMIKWDSCSHLTFGDSESPGYLHLCGVVAFQTHVWLMEELYRMAFERMGREPEPDEVWIEDRS